MSLTGTTPRLTASEESREPRSLAVVAWFDGWGRGANPNARPYDYPRPLTPGEETAWREGHAEGQAERRRHDAHGFATCETSGCDGGHQ